MGFGKMRTFVDIISTKPVKDSEGFAEKGDVILASVRAYKEDKHGSEKWANRAAFFTQFQYFAHNQILLMVLIKKAAFQATQSGSLLVFLLV
jgi:hypothetical protein